MELIKIAVIITCHNRREKTLRCLDALFLCDLSGSAFLDVFLVDDGSSDGTSDAIRVEYPQVRLLRGDGKLYWNGGMRKAFAAAMELDFDYYLWLNDDTYLYPLTIAMLLKTSADIRIQERKAAIVIGSTQESEIGIINHGGVLIDRGWWSSRLADIGEKPVFCETLNGNCVLIPKDVARSIGNLDPIFIHTMGDLDYGFRARGAGFLLVVMPAFAGICQSNPSAGTYQDESLPLGERLSKISGIKGRPFKLWLIFLWRHFRWMGLWYWSGTYLKVILTWLRACMYKGRMNAGQ